MNSTPFLGSNQDKMDPLIAAHPWEKTPLGPLESWPLTLKGYVSLILNLPIPAIIFWGPQKTQIYNLGYSTIMGPRHPEHLGSTFEACWPEVFPVLNSEMEKVRAGGTFEVKDALIHLSRYGFLEEAYFTFPFSPLRDDAGKIDGVLQQVIEVSDQIFAKRRAEILDLLSSDYAGVLAKAVLQDPLDLSFAILVENGEVVQHHNISVSGFKLPTTSQTVKLSDLGLTHTNSWGDQTTDAFVVSYGKNGFLILGLSTRLRPDEAYLSFLQTFAKSFNSLREVERENSRRVSSERRYQDLTDAIPELIWTAGPDGKLTYVNQNWIQYTGITLADRDAFEWKDFIHPLDLEKVQGLHASVTDKKDKSYAVEYRLKSKEGSYRWFLRRAIRLQDETGAYADWLGSCTDIQDQKNTATLLELKVQEKTRELKSERTFLDTVLQNLETGVVSCDADRNFTFTNASFKKILGLPLEDLGLHGGRKFYDAYLGDGKTVMDPEESPLIQALKGEKIQNFELVVVPHGSSPRHLRSNANPIKGENGEILGAVLAIHDITDIKKAQTEATASNVALKAANKELESFSYSVSHDLRAPLRGIDGFSKALMEDYEEKLDATGKKYLNYVRDGVQRMGKLIDDLLDLSRLTKIEVNLTDVDLSKMASRILQEKSEADPTHQPRVLVQEGLRVRGDYGLLGILLENLLNNAWKFTSKTQNPLIEFGTEVRDGLEVYFVRDTGAGFDMSYENKLFGAFQRLHTAAEFQGTGVGLATVRRIVHRHGGIIWAHGEINKGAAFYFTLPTSLIQKV